MYGIFNKHTLIICKTVKANFSSRKYRPKGLEKLLIRLNRIFLLALYKIVISNQTSYRKLNYSIFAMYVCVDNNIIFNHTLKL